MMPPKRKNASVVKNSSASKKSKNESNQDDLKEKISELKKIKTNKIHKIDIIFPKVQNKTCNIHEDYDCILNQTNIGNNNNKFYVIQLIDIDGNPPEHIVWTRWGRVGEIGQFTSLGPYKNLEEARKIFCKKFKEKSGNDWTNRENFKPMPGKYTLVDVIDMVDTTPVVTETSASTAEEEDVCPSKLDEKTQNLIKRIFDPSMFEYTMSRMNLNVKEMPLGKLSAKQIATALEVLNELGEVIRGERKGDVNELSSRFYTVMPHSFARQRPPAITTEPQLREKLDMLIVLSDVNLAQDLQKKAKPTKTTKQKPNPWDEKYALLNCELQHIEMDHPDQQLIQNFFNNTGNKGHKILNVWKVKRAGEDDRFRPHTRLANRQLLWHGTSVAVVAAILSSGLRIMPHSGGLVGRGLYFASQAAKSQGYGMSDRDGHRIMFLAEVALGKEHHIYQPDCSLLSPPDGFDSVVAMGQLETDPSQKRKVVLDDREVIVPFAGPVKRELNTCFHFSEYLIYNESQCKLRYVIEYINQ